MPRKKRSWNAGAATPPAPLPSSLAEVNTQSALDAGPGWTSVASAKPALRGNNDTGKLSYSHTIANLKHRYAERDYHQLVQLRLMRETME